MTEISIQNPISPWVGRWLSLIAFMVLGIVVVGGATRLTGSGLSITEWQPILGAMPPWSEADWQVYDVEVEGVSLVQNYRQQFLRIIRKDSFAELSKQLRTKADRIKAPASNINDVPPSN